MRFYQKFLLGAASAVALTGCIDDKYDLSDIDTTSEFQVKDLVLPVQLDPVLLSDIITVKEGDQIKELTINGETFYGVEEQGTFESDPIHVNNFNAESSPMEPSEAVFRLNGGAGLKGRRANSSKIYLLVEEVKHELEYSATDIDPTVRSLSRINFRNLDFAINLSLKNLGSNLNSQLEDVVLRMPKGLTVTGITAPGYSFKASDYNPASGLLSLGTVDVANNATSIRVTTNSIDLSYYPDAFRFVEAENVGKMDLLSEFTIQSGKLAFNATPELLAQLPDELTFNVAYNLGELYATSILGSIQYDLEGTGLAIDPIELNNIPDFLQDPETRLYLSNPQIYLNVNNPVGTYGLSYQSGLNIISKREEGDSNIPLDTDIKVEGKVGSYNYLLAPNPSKVTNIPADYQQGLDRITYSRLGEILAGEGLPQSLDIQLVNPMIPLQKLSEPFKLGTDIEGMKGNYYFIAPLALEGKSRIIYTKTEDGWWSEDLSDLTITQLTLTTDASSDIPMNATLAVYPLDKDGNRISGLDIVPAKLDAMASDQHLTFVITGTIQNLDGVFITATVIPDDSNEVLKPSQNIVLKNIRVKVSGNYTKKF